LRALRTEELEKPTSSSSDKRKLRVFKKKVIFARNSVIERSRNDHFSPFTYTILIIVASTTLSQRRLRSANERFDVFSSGLFFTLSCQKWFFLSIESDGFHRTRFSPSKRNFLENLMRFFLSIESDGFHRTRFSPSKRNFLENLMRFFLSIESNGFNHLRFLLSIESNDSHRTRFLLSIESNDFHRMRFCSSKRKSEIRGLRKGAPRRQK